jgi:acyl-CoA synthetase (AMP-forming)/AMP-acid ligase II
MQYKNIKRESLLSYLDDYEQRGTETVFVSTRTQTCTLVVPATCFHFPASFLRVPYGIGAGIVILCGHNSPEWAAAFWACLLIGAVVVPG